MALCFVQQKRCWNGVKRRGKKNQSPHCGRDKGIPSSCPWFATSTTRQASSWIANHGHSDGIPLSLPQCGDRFYYSPTGDRSVPKICKSGEILSHHNVSHPGGWDNIFAPSFRAKYIMTSQRCQKHYITIGSSVIALCFVQLKRH